MLKISCKPRNLPISLLVAKMIWSFNYFLILNNFVINLHPLNFNVWMKIVISQFFCWFWRAIFYKVRLQDCKHVKICIPDLLHTGHCHFGFFSFIIRYKDASKHCRWSQVEERHGVVIRILPRKFGKKILVRFYIKIN